MPKTPTKNPKAGEAAIAAGETGGQPVSVSSAAPPPPDVDTSDMSRKEKAAVRVMVDAQTVRPYVVTITDRVRPARQNEITLHGVDGWPHLFRRGLVAPDATAEQKDAAKKRRIVTQPDVKLTPSAAKDLAARGWMVAPATQDKE